MLFVSMIETKICVKILFGFEKNEKNRGENFWINKENFAPKIYVFLLKKSSYYYGQVSSLLEHYPTGIGNPFISGHTVYIPIELRLDTVCPGSSDPPEKIFNIFASENEVYTIY